LVVKEVDESSVVASSPQAVMATREARDRVRLVRSVRETMWTDFQ
jgi:hypothetical protein